MPAADVLKRASEGIQIPVPDLAKATGRSRDALYRAIRRGEIKAVRLGRTPMILPSEALRLLGVRSDSPEPIAA